MRTPYVILLLCFAGCGSAPGSDGPCAGDPALGSGWAEMNDQGALSLTASCTGTDSVCGAFTWTPVGTDHKSTLTVAAEPKDLAVCPSAGTHQCSMYRDFYGRQERLHVACDGQWFRDYTRGTP